MKGILIFPVAVLSFCPRRTRRRFGENGTQSRGVAETDLSPGSSDIPSDALNGLSVSREDLDLNDPGSPRMDSDLPRPDGQARDVAVSFVVEPTAGQGVASIRLVCRASAFDRDYDRDKKLADILN